MTKCIICFAEHDRTWGEDPSQPAMYCEPCAKIKNDSEGVISEILPTLFLSGQHAAKDFEGTRLYVHENDNQYNGHYPQIHIPILTKKPNSSVDRTGAVASIQALNWAVQIIDTFVKGNRNLLVHCHGGVERSPLTLAWYFTKQTGTFATLKEAYDFLKSKRPVVSERMFWLPY
jgi:hypothetical protein